jgi:hypothetical protein
MLMSYVNVESIASPLSIEVNAKVRKIAITFVLNERGSQYDHIFEANVKQDEINTFDSRFAYSHYMLSLNNFESLIKINNVKRKKIIQSINTPD